MHRLEASAGQWTIKNRWWIIIFTTLIVTFLASGVQYITFNNDIRAFFSEENPQLKALEALEDTYTKNESVFFAIAARNGDIFTRETLAAIEELTEESWKMPYSSRVDSLSNYQHTIVVGDDLIVENLVRDAENLSDEDLKRIKGIALSEIQLVNHLVSSKGHVAGVGVDILFPEESKGAGTKVITYARKLADDFRKKYPQIEIYMTGGIPFDYAIGEVSSDDISRLIPLMLLVLLIIIGFALRSFAGTLSTFIVILISMVSGLGFAGWVGISLTTPSSVAPIVILTLAVADSIHILVLVFNFIRQGRTKNEAIEESLRINLQPVFLTSLTTAIGFLTMNFSDAPPFRDLGNIVAVGVMLAFFYSAFFLPALIAVLPVTIRARSDHKIDPSCDRLADFVIKRRRPVFWCSLIVIFALTIGIARIEFNDNWIKYFDEKYDIRKSTDFVEQNLTGFNLIEYSLDSGKSAGISDPRYLKTVEAFANWYRQQPKVDHVNSITDTIKRLNKNMHENDPKYYQIPEDRNLAAQYLLLYEMSLPFGLNLNNRINVDKSATRLSVSINNATTKELRAMDERARLWLRKNAPQPMYTYGTGVSIIWAHISERNIHTMLGAAFLALLLISVILIFVLRSIRTGLLSLIPNLLPAFMAIGLWGFLVSEIGLAVSVIVSMTIGIVVDDTVHFLSKYLRARRENKANKQEAVRFAFNTVGTAMWITSVALIAGFTVLTFSGFQINSDLGQLTAITIMWALIMDFLFLPTLLM